MKGILFMMKNHELAIIILNYNNFLLTENLINNLKEHRISSEIVVVDNNSPNESYQYLLDKYGIEENIHVIKTNSNIGYSGGNNYGINYICNKIESIRYIAIMNPDVEIITDSIFDNLVSALKNDNKLVAVTALTLLNDVFEFPNSSCYKYCNSFKLIFQNVFLFKNLIRDRYSELKCRNNIAYVHKVQGCFFVIKKDEFYKLGLFDDSVFLYFEEEILAKKIKDSNLKSGVLVSELIKHNHKQKDDEYKDLKKRKFHNEAMLASKKYYMLNYMKTNYFVWAFSNILDRFTRLIKTSAIVCVNIFKRKE